MNYSLGVDIGSVNAKLCLIDQSGQALWFDTEKITANPKTALNSLLSRLEERFPREQIISAGVSGSAKNVIPKELNWQEYSSSLAIASGLLHHHPEAKTIIQIGGQTSLVIELEDGLKKPWKVASNPLCAAAPGDSWNNRPTAWASALMTWLVWPSSARAARPASPPGAASSPRAT